MELVGIDEVEAAAALLKDIVLRTPLESSRAISDVTGGDVYLKCENLQRTGAFKIRGAYNRIARLSDDERARGVVCASAGNHAQGVALAASMLGVKSTVFMPEGAALPKLEATQRYGADVHLEGSVYDEAAAAAVAFADERGAVMVHPFDHRDVIAGQGTIALELLEQLPNLASIIVPIGGGGLISGIAAAIKARRSDVQVIGVEPDGAACMAAALAAGEPVDLSELSTVADGLAARRVGELTLAHVKAFVDDVVTVSDEEIARGLLMMAERAKLVVEPAGAAGVAGVISEIVAPPSPCVILLSGGNVDPLLLQRIIRFGMGTSGRYLSFRTRISDRPGELHRLLGVIAAAGGNVVGIEHHREGVLLHHLGDVEVAVQVETRGLEHVDSLRSRISEAGYIVESL